MALDVIKPPIVDLLPGYWEHGRVLLKDRLGLPHQVLALGGVQFAVDLEQEGLERRVMPLRLVLRAVLAIPGVEVIGRIDQHRGLNVDGDVEGAPLRFPEPH